jgi:hypothetical protein
MTIFSDTDFTVIPTDDYFLSGQMDTAGLSYAVTDDRGHCRLLKTFSYPRAALSYDEWAKELGELFAGEPTLSQSFAASRWSILSNKATLLPDSLVDPEHLRFSLAYAAPLDDLDEIHYHSLPCQELACVFAVPSPPANVITRYLPNTQFFHPQIQLFELAEMLDHPIHALLYVMPKLMSVTFFSKNRLLQSNTYFVDTIHDVLYHLLAITKWYGLAQDAFTLYYMGQVSDDDANLLGRYIKYTECLYDANADRLLGRRQAALYHPLLALGQCE